MIFTFELVICVTHRLKKSIDRKITLNVDFVFNSFTLFYTFVRTTSSNLILVKTLRTLFFVILAMVSTVSFAAEPSTPPVPGYAPPPPGYPIDQFLLPMLGLAIAYGVYVLFSRTRKVTI